ncbi:MAG TPA: hypothetical protein VFW33_14330, partial [Gemmataceae bacterium]|nr:hypothetical protein [Gemmataceae bacterium]
STATDPRGLLREAHKAYDEGKFDEAVALAQKAKVAPGAKDCWGLFDFDTPDKLITEVNKARQKKNEQEAAKLLADGRKTLEQAQKDEARHGELLDQAQKMALKADTLRNGTYSVWELGDRPSKLLADIDAERKKGRGKTVPPVPPIGAAVATNEGTGRWPAGAPDDGQVRQARALMADARSAARAGNTTAAAAAVDTVERMNIPADRLGSDSPAAVRRELALAPGAGGIAPPAPTRPSAPADRSTNGQARALVAEARQLQQQGRLLEARARLLDAQRLPANFGPDEDRPEKALLDLAGVARRQIDRLETSADDSVHRGETQKYAEVEEKLAEAQALARGFQLDTYLLDKKLAWVHQARGASAGPSVAQAGTPPIQRVEGRTNVTDGGPQGQGEQMLTQARMEIRAGNTGAARRIVEQVYAGNFGLKAESENLLREIDVEEYEQKKSEQKRTFDAGNAAFRRGDYQLASHLFRAVDAKLLDPERQSRLKELMRLPELQPEQPAEAVAQAGGPGVAPPPGAGSAHADDSRETTYLQQVDAMRQIKFQKMREQELDAEKRAHKLADMNDTEQAIAVLQEYLSRLPEAGLEPDKTALLRRPVEAKLQQYQTLAAQTKIKNASADALRLAKSNHEQKVQAEENKQQRMKELMDKYNGLYKQAKYREAEMFAMQAQELDPDNPVAAAAVQIARTQVARTKFQRIKDKKEGMTLDGLDDGEDVGVFTDTYKPIQYDKSRTAELRRHRPIDLKAINGLKSEKEREIEHRLDTPVSLNFREVPLGKVLDDITAENEINVLPDLPALNNKGISLSEPVTFHVDNMTLKSALTNMLHNMGLTYVVEHEALRITTPENARGNLILVPYQVTELVIPVPDSTPTPMLPNQIQPPPNNNPYSPGQQSTASPVTGPFSMANGQSVGSPGGPSVAAAGGNWDTKKYTGATRQDELIQLIQNTIAPRSWSSMGGQGTIDYFPLTMTLVINQTTDIQEQIADLLQALRRLQDAEVAVEIRLISIAEGFFERIGVDF